MKTLKALKSRREGVEKINKMARAMEAIASTRLHRYEAEVSRFKAFVLAQRSIMENLTLRLERVKSSWTQLPERDKPSWVILISSDRGFCGGFNNQLFQTINRLEDKKAFSFIVVGKKGARAFRKQRLNLREEFALPDLAQIFNFAQALAEKILSSYMQKQTGKVFLLFNEFRHHLLGRSLLKQLLPLQPLQNEELILDYLFEPNEDTVLEKLLPVYVQSEIKSAILESQAAEEMSRMVAMTQARRNADELIAELTQKYHKARQAGITRELVEISSAI